MQLSIKITLTAEEIKTITYARGYAHTVVMIEELPDGTRQNVEKLNPQTATQYLLKMYEDLIVSDIVNTIVGYTNRVGEERDHEQEREKRNEIEGIVTTSAR